MQTSLSPNFLVVSSQLAPTPPHQDSLSFDYHTSSPPFRLGTSRSFDVRLSADRKARPTLILVSVSLTACCSRPTKPRAHFAKLRSVRTQALRSHLHRFARTREELFADGSRLFRGSYRLLRSSSSPPSTTIPLHPTDRFATRRRSTSSAIPLLIIVFDTHRPKAPSEIARHSPACRVEAISAVTAW